MGHSLGAGALKPQQASESPAGAARPYPWGSNSVGLGKGLRVCILTSSWVILLYWSGTHIWRVTAVVKKGGDEGGKHSQWQRQMERSIKIYLPCSLLPTALFPVLPSLWLVLLIFLCPLDPQSWIGQVSQCP